MATSAPQSPKTDVCLLWTPPQELLNSIFARAYGNHRRKLFVRLSPEPEASSERLSALDMIDKKPPPSTRVVDRFLVCKEFFINAVEAFMQPLLLAQGTEWGNPSRDIYDLHLFRLFCTDAQAFTVPRIQQLQRFVHLRALSLSITARHLKEGSTISKSPWGEILSGTDLDRLQITKALKQLRGIIYFSCIPDWGTCEMLSGQKLLVFKQNIARLEDYLRVFVVSSKTEHPYEISSTYKGPAALYPGSRVTGIGGPSALLTSAQLKGMFSFSASEGAELSSEN
ncbi:hypothetical protein BST61_g9653 [Cercospora zeina]